MNFRNEESDLFLISQLSLGKEDAFDFIFRKYYKVLSIQAIRFVHDQDLAQSLVQDCFVRFWEKRQGLNNVEDLYSYLFFMVRNHCIDHVRKEKRNHQVSLTNQADLIEDETVEKMDADELGSHLWQAIATLPDRCRIAFEYSRIDGFTYPEIAQLMGISLKAVEALISRSLKILRIKLVQFMNILIMLFI